MAPKKSLFQTDFDVPEIVRFFGGRAELVRLLNRFKIVQITPAAIDKWQSRGKIPAERMMDLQTLAARLKKKFVHTDFITAAPAKPAPKKAA